MPSQMTQPRNIAATIPKRIQRVVLVSFILCEKLREACALAEAGAAMFGSAIENDMFRRDNADELGVE